MEIKYDVIEKLDDSFKNFSSEVKYFKKLIFFMNFKETYGFIDAKKYDINKTPREISQDYSWIRNYMKHFPVLKDESLEQTLTLYELISSGQVMFRERIFCNIDNLNDKVKKLSTLYNK